MIVLPGLAQVAIKASGVLQCYEPNNYTLGATPTAATGTPTHIAQA